MKRKKLARTPFVPAPPKIVPRAKPQIDFTTTPPDRYVIFTRRQLCLCCGSEREHSEFFAERTWLNTSTKAQCFHRQPTAKPEFNVPICWRFGEWEQIAFCNLCPQERIAITMQKLRPAPRPESPPLGWIVASQAQASPATAKPSAKPSASLSDLNSL